MFEGVSSPSILLLRCCITNLTGMKSFDSVSRSDVTFTSSEIKEWSQLPILYSKWYCGWTGGCIPLGLWLLSNVLMKLGSTRCSNDIMWSW